MISVEEARDAVAAYAEPLYRGPGRFGAWPVDVGHKGPRE